MCERGGGGEGRGVLIILYSFRVLVICCCCCCLQSRGHFLSRFRFQSHGNTGMAEVWFLNKYILKKSLSSKRLTPCRREAATMCTQPDTPDTEHYTSLRLLCPRTFPTQTWRNKQHRTVQMRELPRLQVLYCAYRCVRGRKTLVWRGTAAKS